MNGWKIGQSRSQWMRVNEGASWLASSLFPPRGPFKPNRVESVRITKCLGRLMGNPEVILLSA
jgi:hypothetical protein